MRSAFAILAATAALASAAGAQEPSHLARLHGECRTADGDVLGAYTGRVLWMASGQFSGMLTIDPESATPPAESAPRTLTVHKQTPQHASNGGDDVLTVTTTAALGASDGADETDVVCTLTSTTTSNG